MIADVGVLGLSLKVTTMQATISYVFENETKGSFVLTGMSRGLTSEFFLFQSDRQQASRF